MNYFLIFLRNFVPKPVFGLYHYVLAFLAHLFYGMPSKKLYVIGVIGTKGKTTTSNLIADILNFAGMKTGMTSSVKFRIGEKVWINDTKHGMPGRFFLQKLIAQMVKEGCKYAVIETTSEGILQYRHSFIDYNAVVFTNFSPEHIERHKSFENYRNTKVKLFEKLAKKKDGIGVYNLDDENVEYFLKPVVARKVGYGLGKCQMSRITNIELSKNGTSFYYENVKFTTSLIGEFNVYNAVAGIVLTHTLGVSSETIRLAFLNIKPIEGRFEIINTKWGFTVIIDYAHEPRSLEEAYKAAQLFLQKKPRTNADTNTRTNADKTQTNVEKTLTDADKIQTCARGRLICLLGAQGGGRDKWKRPKMGEIAAKYCDEIVLTNEDPYDENPLKIIEDIVSGFLLMSNVKCQISNVYKILDRREAIHKAISLAKPGDVIILTGKGGEVWMCVENNRKIPWNEKEIVEETLKNRASEEVEIKNQNSKSKMKN